MSLLIGKHRAAAQVDTRVHPHSFRPRHCAGTSCLHNHSGASTPLPIMRIFTRAFRRSVAA